MANTPSFQQKYLLTFSPAVGGRLLYMLNTSVQVEGRDFTGKEISLGAMASGEISFDIKRTVNDLVFIGLTTPGIFVEAQTLEGPESYALKTKGDQAVQASFSQKGYVNEVHNLEALTRDRIWNISLAQILRDYLPGLPENSVSIGEAWRDTKLITIPYQGIDLEVSIERTYILQNVIPSIDGDVAFISIEYDVLLSGTKNLGEWMGRFERQAAFWIPDRKIL